MELIRGLHNLRDYHRGCVATIGNFDGVHLGHQMILSSVREKAQQLGLPSVVIVFELTGSYEWSVLAMVSVVTSQQYTRAYAGRSLFYRQISLRGIKLSDDHK